MQPIKRIARRRRGFHEGQDMLMVNRNKAQSEVLYHLGKLGQRCADGALSEPGLDGDFPKACDARESRGLGIHDPLPQSIVEEAQPLIDKADQDVCIEKQAHGSIKRPEQEILWQRRVKILSHIGEHRPNSALAFVRPQCLEIKPTRWAMPDHFEDRLAVAGDACRCG
jgi:hypothetical protein